MQAHGTLQAIGKLQDMAGDGAENEAALAKEIAVEAARLELARVRCSEFIDLQNRFEQLGPKL